MASKTGRVRAALIGAFLSMGLVAGYWGCSDSGTPVEAVCDDGKDDDNDGKTDCADDDCASAAACKTTGQDGGAGDGGQADAALPDYGYLDAPAGPTLARAVMNTLTLPTSATESAVDIDGDGSSRRAAPSRPPSGASSRTSWRASSMAGPHTDIHCTPGGSWWRSVSWSWVWTSTRSRPRGARSTRW